MPQRVTPILRRFLSKLLGGCSHLWGGSAKYQLEALDSVDRRARRIHHHHHHHFNQWTSTAGNRYIVESSTIHDPGSPASSGSQRLA
ncbi:jg5138 [Pararge aegeria aegeria]|uniref:Jg5138 protein n=1 Tax=Pararge aegeria aegeria TaxID=348720 RepID=A0A8S4S0H5_9NEOP|nr:jg5138 [Pararge aegeria aegeria]